jgi:hypothetical protein
MWLQSGMMIVPGLWMAREAEWKDQEAHNDTVQWGVSSMV